MKNITMVGFTHWLGIGGGTIHTNFLISSWESTGIKTCISDLVSTGSFTFLSVIKATVRSLFVGIDNLTYVEKSNIILSESPYPPDIILAFRFSRKYNKPIVIYFHHITPDISVYPFRRGFFRVALNVLYTTIALFFVRHFQIPIFLDNPRSLDDSSIAVYPDLDAIPHNVSIDMQTRPDSKVAYDICYVGRIENHKGIEDVIHVIRTLKVNAGLNLKVVLAGKGKEKYVRKIKKMINRYDLTNSITLKGYVSELEKYDLLKKSRIFLFLSYEEGWSISVMEAAYSNTPIIAYDLPAYYYLKGNYFPVNLGDIQMCALTVKEVLDNYTLAKTRSVKAKECVDRFSYEFIARQQLVFFKKIIENYGVDINV